ncbi:Methylthioribose-1-phosphate isomerase [Raoultella terrigena]|uniref:Methylthioribose-1-phosphate isomerase n=1 Tax=Raoultella terrigena TaxID=577 RepID=A0A4U9DBA1_RAOTE|nr:Methylthioribose-1-phosphate isomerase [Raoultella terrigena]
MPYQLITDSMAASLMAKGQVRRGVGCADRIAANGDVANKIGTYSLAVLANITVFRSTSPRRKPPSTAAVRTARPIPIWQRAAAEVTGVAGSFGAVQWAPADASVYNPAFDVTPAALISGWVLDSGVVTQEQVAAGAFAPSVA